MEICPEGTMTKIKFVELVEVQKKIKLEKKGNKILFFFKMSCKSKNYDEENEEEDQKSVIK